MERKNNKQLAVTLAWGIGFYYILTQIDNLFTGDPLQSPLNFLKKGQVKEPKPVTPKLSTDGCTISREKLVSMVRGLEEEAESFRNQVFNSSYTETLKLLEPLQTDCDVNALKREFGVRWIGITRRYDLDETLRYIFGDGSDVGILNNWIRNNRKSITYRF